MQTTTQAERPIQKLRFPSRRDFWGFVTHMSLSRLHEYNPPSVNQPVQSGFVFPQNLLPTI